MYFSCGYMKNVNFDCTSYICIFKQVLLCDTDGLELAIFALLLKFCGYLWETLMPVYLCPNITCSLTTLLELNLIKAW